MLVPNWFISGSFYHDHHIHFTFPKTMRSVVLLCLIKHFGTNKHNSSCSALEPSSLNLAIYPLLSSYDTPDKQAYPRHSLSRAALITSGSPIFLLDAFTTLIVFYSSTASAAIPFPPPQDCKWCFINLFLSTEKPLWFRKVGLLCLSDKWFHLCLSNSGLLRTTINKLKQERIITPKLTFIRGGHDDATSFENYLIEEQDVEGSGFTSVMGFVSFLDEVNHGVVEYMSKLNGK